MTNQILATLIITLNTNWVEVPTQHDRKCEVGIVAQETWVEVEHKGKPVKRLLAKEYPELLVAPLRYSDHVTVASWFTNIAPAPFFRMPPTNLWTNGGPTILLDPVWRSTNQVKPFTKRTDDNGFIYWK